MKLYATRPLYRGQHAGGLVARDAPFEADDRAARHYLRKGLATESKPGSAKSESAAKKSKAKAKRKK